MDLGTEVLRLRTLSDAALLSGLASLLSTNRRTTAEVVAHLGEVEDRRLHLLAGHGSMFAYCVSGLGMSEDEACRRIDVARLVRRFPPLLARLAAGQITLSVACLLKPHATEENHIELIDAVSGITVARAREVLATWFPRPDVLPRIIKLPTRRVTATAAAPEAGGSNPGSQDGGSPRVGTEPNTPEWSTPRGSAAPGAEPPNAHREAEPTVARASVEHGDDTARALLPFSDASSLDASMPLVAAPPKLRAHDSSTHAPPLHDSSTSTRPPAAPAPVDTVVIPSSHARAAPRSIEPLSAERYKVQLTAGATLKSKLELARDLLRHAVPTGDLAAIIERALDLLIERTMKRRFAVTDRPKASPRARSKKPLESVRDAKPPAHEATMAEPSANDAPTDARSTSNTSTPSPIEPAAKASTSSGPTLAPPTHDVHDTHRDTRHIPSSARRSVLARDDLRCSWRAPDGTRCNNRAWLEHDHITPRGHGGSHDPANIRLVCWAHNGLSAEQAYGRDTITKIVARKRARRQTPPTSNRDETGACAPGASPTDHRAP